MLSLFAVILGCRSEGTPPPAGRLPAEDPAPAATPWEYEGGDAAAPVFDALAVEGAMDAALAMARTISAAPVFAGYDAAMAAAEPACPSWYDYEGNVYWYANCTTSAGTWFGGYGFLDTYVAEDIYGDGTIWDARTAFGSATVRAADGTTFHLGGGATIAQGLNPDGWVIHQSTVQGSFVWEGAEGADWLAAGASPNFALYAAHLSGEGWTARYAVADGALSVDGPDGPQIAELDRVTLSDRATGWPCPEEPGGAMAVRTADGAWWDVQFDVDVDTWQLTGDCDGCGTVSANGVVVGTACVDASPLLDWEESPW